MPSSASTTPRDPSFELSPLPLQAGGPRHSPWPSPPRAPTSMMFSCSTLEATLNSGALWRYRPSATQKQWVL